MGMLSCRRGKASGRLAGGLIYMYNKKFTELIAHTTDDIYKAY